MPPCIQRKRLGAELGDLPAWRARVGASLSCDARTPLSGPGIIATRRPTRERFFPDVFAKSGALINGFERLGQCAIAADYAVDARRKPRAKFVGLRFAATVDGGDADGKTLVLIGQSCRKRFIVRLKPLPKRGHILGLAHLAPI